MKRGFTLIELLLVVTLLGLVTFLLATNTVSFSKRTELAPTSQTIKNVLLAARANALSGIGDKSWGVHFETTKIVLFGGPTFVADDPGNQTTNISDQIDLSWNLGGANEVIFAKITATTAEAGTITLTNAGSTKQITINVLGKIEAN